MQEVKPLTRRMGTWTRLLRLPRRPNPRLDNQRTDRRPTRKGLPRHVAAVPPHSQRRLLVIPNLSRRILSSDAIMAQIWNLTAIGAKGLTPDGSWI